VAKPLEGETFLLHEIASPQVTCDDETEVASCTYGGIDTSTVGTKLFTAVATDNTGNTTTVSHTYRVVYDFAGFDGVFKKHRTTAKAGQKIDAEFTLGGNQGPSVLAAGSPTSRTIPCSGPGAPGPEQSATGTLTFAKKGSSYTYHWSTVKSWEGTCRQFLLHLVDGTTQTFDVSFVK
jgi:hypothetical protein